MAREYDKKGLALLTRHSMAIEIGSDCFLQLVVRRRLLEPQTEVALQVLVELVTWKQQERGESRVNLFPPNTTPTHSHLR